MLPLLIQACFNREAGLAVDITSAADVAAVEAVDIEDGWPS